MDSQETGPDRVRALLEEARDWALRTGWPTRDQDLSEAARTLARLHQLPLTPQARGERLLRTLEQGFRKTGSAPLYRAVLARMVIRLSGLDT